jgi:YHS domain-containing protein
MRTRRALLAITSALAATAVGGVSPARAGSPINETWTGIAIKGFDPVAYFVERRPVRGSAAHRLEWMGATWQFASAAHRDAFAADPARFAPQYGGYCAFAVSEGITADIDPTAWRIVEDRLYLNLSPEVQRLWEADVPGRIRRADANWPAIRAQLGR